MNTNIINKYASEATVLDTAAKNIKHSATRGFMLTIGGRFEGSRSASTGEIRMLNHAHMPQAARDQLSAALESVSQVLKNLIKAEADAPLEDDHHDLYHKAMDELKKKGAVVDVPASDDEPEVESFKKLQGMTT